MGRRWNFRYAKSYITHCDSPNAPFAARLSRAHSHESRLLEAISIPYTAVKMVAVVLGKKNGNRSFERCFDYTGSVQPLRILSTSKWAASRDSHTWSWTRYIGIVLVPCYIQFVFVSPVSCQCQQQSSVVRLSNGTVTPPCSCLMGRCQVSRAFASGYEPIHLYCICN